MRPMRIWSHGVRRLLVVVATAVTLSADAEEKESAPYAAEMNGKYYATLAVDTSKGADVSGLKLKYAKGTIVGAFTVYEVSNEKLLKNKFAVNGVVVDGVGYGLATNKKLKPISVEVR